MWQSSRPASFSPVGLSLSLNWLEHWLETLRMLSTLVQIPVGLSVPGRYIGGWSAGLGKARRIDSALRTDWLSCFWPDENGGLPDRGVWCYWGREECDNPAGLQASRQRADPWAKLVRALAHDSENANNPGSNTSGVVSARTLQ